MATGTLDWSCPVPGCSFSDAAPLGSVHNVDLTGINNWAQLALRYPAIAAIRRGAALTIKRHHARHTHQQRKAFLARPKHTPPPFVVLPGPPASFGGGGWLCPYCDPPAGVTADKTALFNKDQLSVHCRRHASEAHGITDWKKWAADSTAANGKKTYKINGRRIGWHFTTTAAKKKKVESRFARFASDYGHQLLSLIHI